MKTYTPQHFAQMLADPVRAPAFIQALKEAITPETIVLDLGAGTGGFTLLACALGAKKVIAVEPNPAIQIARELVKENGFEDRVIFHEEIIENLNFSQVDLIIADLRGKLPLYENNLPIMKLAQEKYLKPNGKVLPFRDTIYLALSKDQELFNNIIKPFVKYDFKFTSKCFQKYLANSFYPVQINSQMITGETKRWCQIDYREIKDYSYKSKVCWDGNQDTVYGFFGWFDCELTAKISFTCGPESKNKVYGSVFFPFEEAITLRAEQSLEIELSAIHLEGDYVWRWKTSLLDLKTNSKKIVFDQSTFYGAAFSLAAIENSQQLL